MGISLKIGFFAFTILLVGCGRDFEQAKRYSEMKSECDSIIALADLVINDQITRSDSLRKIRNMISGDKTSVNKILRIDKEITNAVEIETNVTMVKNILKQ